MRIESGKEEIIRYSYICDLCGKGVSQHRTCGICGRDLCTDCTRFDPRDIVNKTVNFDSRHDYLFSTKVDHKLVPDINSEICYFRYHHSLSEEISVYIFILFIKKIEIGDHEG